MLLFSGLMPNAELGRARADGIGHVARGQMAECFSTMTAWPLFQATSISGMLFAVSQLMDEGGCRRVVGTIGTIECGQLTSARAA